MTVSPTVLTNGMAGSSGTSFNTASISPTANKLITVAVYSRFATGTANTPTLSGASMTWTNVVASSHGAGNCKFSIFRALSASPGSGAITIDFSGQTQQMCHWSITSWDGIDTGGTNGSNAVPQSKAVQNNNSTTSMTATLDSSINSTGNAIYGGMGLVDVVGSGITPGDGETELADQTNNATFNWRTQFQWKLGIDNSMSWSYSSGGNQPTGAMIEIKSSTDNPKIIIFV